MLKRLHTFALGSCLVCCLTLHAPEARSDSKENLVKAAFIYNFIKFIDWPDSKSITQQSHINICVVGDSSLSEAGPVFQAASTPKLALTLLHENNIRNVIAKCHIAFISESESDRISEVLGALKGAAVLTVSDMPNFAEYGGMIGFVADDNKVKVAVNKRSFTTSGMRIDAQLLEIAQKVIDK